MLVSNTQLRKLTLFECIKFLSSPDEKERKKNDWNTGMVPVYFINKEFKSMYKNLCIFCESKADFKSCVL